MNPPSSNPAVSPLSAASPSPYSPHTWSYEASCARRPDGSDKRPAGGWWFLGRKLSVRRGWLWRFLCPRIHLLGHPAVFQNLLQYRTHLLKLYIVKHGPIIIEYPLIVDAIDTVGHDVRHRCWRDMQAFLAPHELLGERSRFLPVFVPLPRAEFAFVADGCSVFFAGVFWHGNDG